MSLLAVGCSPHKQFKIAVIPQTEGNMHWDPAHTGVEAAAERAGVSVYWNAPTREDDAEAQIALVDRVVSDNYQGLVLAPDQALSLITPVRRALAHGIPTVIIGSALPIPGAGNLFYILNDDVAGGRMAAERVAFLLDGHGTVALLGINPDITGIMVRTRAFEESLAQNHPGIQIVAKRMGTFNVAHEQQVAEDTLRAYPDLDVVVALMWPTIDGTISALDTTPTNNRVKIIGFDPFGFPSFDQKSKIDSVIQQDTRFMGQRAIELIYAKRMGQQVPTQVYVQPKLLCRENAYSADVRQMISGDWMRSHWVWGPAQ